jgi:hypothetical protein
VVPAAPTAPIVKVVPVASASESEPAAFAAKVLSVAAPTFASVDSSITASAVGALVRVTVAVFVLAYAAELAKVIFA